MMPPLISAVLLIASLCLVPSSSCPDNNPEVAIRTTLDCIEQERLFCSTAGYDSSSFEIWHNGVLDVEADVSFFGWFFIFLFVDLSFELEEIRTIDAPDNVVFLRYVERIETPTRLFWKHSTEYPFGQVFLQHEQANITLDDRCRMIQWNQTGDEDEQSSLPEAIAAMLKAMVGPTILAILCFLGLVPSSAC